MKRILRFLPMMAIMFGCVFSFTACESDDDNDEGGNTGGDIVINGNNNGGSDTLNITNTKLLKSVGDLIFKYNENNSLVSIEKATYGSEDSKMEVTYNPLTFRYTYKYNSESWNENNVLIVSNIKFNANGHVTSCTFASDYQYHEYEGKGGNKDNGNIAFKYNGTNLTGIDLIGNGSEYEEDEDGEKYSLNYNFSRNCILTWSNGNLQSISITSNTTAGNYGYYKLNSTLTYKYGNKQNETAQYTHAFADYLSYIFLEDEFTGLCYMNLFGEPSIDFPTSVEVTQTDEESYMDYEYNSTLEATETYSNYYTDRDGYLLSYQTEGEYKYSDNEYASGYSKTTYYNYTDNSDVTPDYAPAKKQSNKSLKERKAKGFFNRRK
ncbi:MAG: hypothetical protein E7089_09915 [Bacteroidales bacterium]|nr:hypothetical protein [Bacteroidales bacterium]